MRLCQHNGGRVDPEGVSAFRIVSLMFVWDYACLAVQREAGLLSAFYSTVLNLAAPHQIQHLDTSVMATLNQVLPVSSEFGYFYFYLTFGSEQSGKGIACIPMTSITCI